MRGQGVGAITTGGMIEASDMVTVGVTATALIAKVQQSIIAAVEMLATRRTEVIVLSDTFSGPSLSSDLRSGPREWPLKATLESAPEKCL